MAVTRGGTPVELPNVGIELEEVVLVEFKLCNSETLPEGRGRTEESDPIADRIVSIVAWLPVVPFATAAWATCPVEGSAPPRVPVPQGISSFVPGCFAFVGGEESPEADAMV